MDIKLEDNKDFLPNCERCEASEALFELRNVTTQQVPDRMCAHCCIRHLSVDSENIESVLDSIEARGNMTKPAKKLDEASDQRIREFHERDLGPMEIAQIMGVSRKTVYKSLKRTEPVIKD